MEELPKYINILDLNEEFNLINKLEVKTIDGTYVLNRNRIKGKHFSDYRKTLMSGDMEKAIQNLIAILVEEPTDFSLSQLMMKDISTYLRLNKALQLIIGDSESFL